MTVTRRDTWGKGVLDAIDSVNFEIADAIVGMDVTEQMAIDEFMVDLDGTANKEILGANAILGVSLAAAKAGAMVTRQPLFPLRGRHGGSRSARFR